jgi:hypothetical protein
MSCWLSNNMSWQQGSLGHAVTSNYGVSRGLEIIPTTRFEVGVSPPNYVAHQSDQKYGIGHLIVNSAMPDTEFAQMIRSAFRNRA